MDHGKKKQWGNGTHNVETIEALEHLHLAHTLSLFPLIFFFGIDFARDVTRRGLGGGILRSCEGGRGGGRVKMGRGWMGCAALSEGNCTSDGTCQVMHYPM